MELDRIDRQLLNLVQQDATQTAEQMAQVVALSPSAIQRRLRRLREQGVIVRDVSVVDPAYLGTPTLFLASVRIERDRPEYVAHFRKWIDEQEQVQEAFYVTGDADFVLIVTAPNAESYDALMSRMQTENPNVKRFTTNVTLNTIKRGLALPVPVDG